MKKLIFIIGILLLTSTAFGHRNSGLLNYFHERPAFEFNYIPFAGKLENGNGRYIYTLTPQKFKALLDLVWMKEDLSIKTYSFFANGKFYMLSYGEDNGNRCYETGGLKLKYKGEIIRLERELNLYRLDDTCWTKASNKPVQVDWENCSKSESSYKCYFPWRIAGCNPNDEKEFRGGAKNGSVNISPYGKVTIVLINHEMANYNEPTSRIIYSNRTIVLTPDGDGNYNVQ